MIVESIVSKIPDKQTCILYIEKISRHDQRNNKEAILMSHFSDLNHLIHSVKSFVKVLLHGDMRLHNDNWNTCTRSKVCAPPD